MKKIYSLILLLFSVNQFAQKKIIKKAEEYIKKKYKRSYHEVLYVSTAQQKMYHIKEKKVLKTYVISSASAGLGNKSGSNKTPLGLHKVKNKIGDKTPLNGRMIGRVYYGHIAKIYTDKTKSKTDDVTSRILWLEGLEKGLNKGKGIDSYKRYIYIHGTSEEGRLGTPASHGCIRMKNHDVVELYNKVKLGVLVLIQ